MLLSSSGDLAAADSATVVKLFRVMLLMPVVLMVVFAMRPTRSVRERSKKMMLQTCRTCLWFPVSCWPLWC